LSVLRETHQVIRILVETSNARRRERAGRIGIKGIFGQMPSVP
jgi:hypothetical protein